MRSDKMTSYQANKARIQRKNELLKEAADYLEELLTMQPSPIKIAGIDAAMKAMKLMTKIDEERER